MINANNWQYGIYRAVRLPILSKWLLPAYTTFWQYQEQFFIVPFFEWWSDAESHGIRPQMGP
jgi:hypothetical protein